MTAQPAILDDVIAWAWDGPPEGSAAAAQARLLLLDSLGCALAGLAQSRPAGFGGALAGWMPGTVRLPGVPASLAPGAAASLLATAMCWDEANDGLARAHGRPGLPVAPLALVSLATRSARLGEAVAAYALGYEVAARAGELWRIKPGMHVDGSWHCLGAAAAAARLAGMDRPAAARAVRLVACQVPFSLYAPIAAGMDGRNLYPAQAVLLGVAAAAAAAAGMDAPAEGLELGRRIALGATAPGSRAPAGEWLLAEGYVKPFAGVRHAHYGAAAALALRPAVAARLEAVRGIRLETYGEAITYAGNRAPATAIKAQFSLSWGVAAALVQGDLGPAAYAAAALADPLLRRLEAMVELHEDPAMTTAGRRAARITLDMGGETLTHAVVGVAGDPGRPMAGEEVRAKFHRLAGPLLGEAAASVATAMLEGNALATPAPFG
ncbi:MmgE/PrpD family protein [Falsiroseomonas sp.]|uniref:MmgE/PrpD family protein n=1 Tax=Falsiroseomonas sp. TaxID=2870721 RepID=UPI0035633F56